MPQPAAYRAPHRSRRDDVDDLAAADRAVRLGLVGVGGRLSALPSDPDEAVHRTDREHDERMARRLERFIAVPDGSFAWTRVGEQHHLGRIDGPWRYDDSAEALELDLVNVRPCAWVPVPVGQVPADVLATFGRGGRNFQRIHSTAAERASAGLWSDLV